MRLKIKEDPREWRKFTLLTLLGFAVLGSVLRWRKVLPVPGWIAWLALMVLVGLMSLLKPAWFRGYYRVGTRFGFRVTQFLGQALLLFVFILVLTPLGLCLRLAGKDLLRLQRDSKAKSYWQTARAPGSLERLF
jgi:hypothetical protein